MNTEDYEDIRLKALQPALWEARQEIKQLKEKLEARELISVENKLPEFGEKVLAYVPNYFGIAYLYGSKWFVVGGQIYAGEPITHWMPLPEAPDA